MHNTGISSQLRDLHSALLDIVAVMNRPQRDQAIIDEAGIKLDRALFPLVVILDCHGPIGIVDLADRVGRDHTTVSRQVAKLESLGLVERRLGATDRRVREASVTPAGKAMNDAIDAARERLATAALGSWTIEDLDRLVHLLRRFAETIRS